MPPSWRNLAARQCMQEQNCAAQEGMARKTQAVAKKQQMYSNLPAIFPPNKLFDVAHTGYIAWLLN